MAVTVSVTGQTTASWNISGLSSPFNSTYYSSAYIVAGSVTSVATDATASNTSTQAQGTISGLSPGTYYSVTGYVKTKSGQTYNVGTTSMTTQSPPPSGDLPYLNTISVTGTAPNATVSASWGTATGATAYDWVSSDGQSGSVTGLSKSITVTTAGSYTFSVTPKNAYGYGLGQIQSYTVAPKPTVPSGTPSVTANASAGRKITYSFTANSVSGATGYSAWLNNQYTDTYLSSVSPNTDYTTTAGAEWYTYRVKIVPTNSVGDGTYGFKDVTTLDETAPTFTTASVSNITDSSIRINYAASDLGSGVNGYKLAVGYGHSLGWDSLSDRGTFYNAGYTDLSGFLANTKYTIGIRVIDKSNNFTTYTTNITTLRSVPTAPTVTARSEGGLTLSWSSVTSATAYQLDYKPSVNSVWQSVQTSSTSYGLTKLAYGLVYNFRARAYNDGWSEYSGTNDATVNPKTPTISGTYNGTNVQIYTAGLSTYPDSNFDYIIIERLTTSGTFVDSKSVTTSGSGVYWSISPSNVSQYKFRAYSSIGAVTSVSYSNYIEFARPEDFNWTNGDKVKGNAVVVLASDWNDLQARINAFRIYKGLATTTFTAVSKGNTITAALYNQLANAINPLGSTGGQIATVSQGSPLTAYAINRLTACLNAVY